MSDLADYHDCLQIADPTSADVRDHRVSDLSPCTSTDGCSRAERRLPTIDVRKLLRWIPRLLIVLVLLCLALAAWVWFEILWGL